MASPGQLGFTVDTHLLRELGRLLVGRDSTALVELIKNAYDADATLVTVHGDSVGSSSGRIVVSDDGTGMTYARFRDAFLRIAGRTKDIDDPYSQLFHRRFTGAKGIGRLAAHKLASTLVVDSIPLLPAALQNGETGDESSCGIHAELHWDRMESERGDLGDLGDTLTSRPLPVLPTRRPGTRLELEGTREPWEKGRLERFLREVQACRPPELLVDALPPDVLPKRLLLGDLRTADRGHNDPGFTLDLTGDFDGGADLWQTLAERASWVVEIDSSPTGLRYGVAPTRTARVSERFAEIPDRLMAARTYRTRHPHPERGPFFQARVLVFEGRFANSRTSELSQFARLESGVRVFSEGFRVLPYGSLNDDWLGLDRDYVNKQRQVSISPALVGDADPALTNEGYALLGNRSYFGAVLLTDEGSAGMEMVVNREGFVPNEPFVRLSQMVRTGLDLSVRARAAINKHLTDAKMDAAKALAAAEAARAQPAEPAADGHAEVPSADTADPDLEGGPVAGTTSPTAFSEAATGDDTDLDDLDDDDDFLDDAPLPDRLGRLLAAADDAARTLLDVRAPTGQPPRVQVEQIRTTLDAVSARLEQARDEELTLRSLAGLGMQYAAFVHEVNSLLAMAQRLRDLVDGLATGTTSTHTARVREARAAADELVQSLTRQASYLTDVVGPDARRRRRRMPVVERVDSAMRLLTPQLHEREQQLEVAVAPTVKTPPIFPAEFAIVMTNLLTNSIKFAGVKGRIRVRADIDADQQLHVVVENTGRKVTGSDRERFFSAFESSTTDVDALLGQGMGLGLPIVRSLVSGYNGTAEFIAPAKGYSTAVEVVLPDPRRRRRAAAA